MKAMKWSEYVKRIEKLDLNTLLGETVNELKIEIEDTQREQMRKGQNSDGGYLPRYVDDPYFKSIQAAKNYENWKAQWSHPEKPRGVMDFFIDGTFHNTVRVVVKRSVFDFKSSSSIESSIRAKTGDKVLALNRESKDEFMKEHGWGVFVKKVSRQTGHPII
jgi:hypothetical protein